MEKVIDLFRAFRNKEIDYETLFGELTKMLSEDPHFSVKAISTLDSAQQLKPIPVTDFINLRAQLESTAETFHQQEITPGPADAENTMLYQEGSNEATYASNTLAPSDPTLMGDTATEASAPTEPAAKPSPTPQPVEDYADEATVIMPMPPRQTAPSNPPSSGTIPPASPNTQLAEEEDDEHATLIADSTASTPSEEATPVHTPVAAQPKPTPSPNPPFALIGGGVAAILVIVLVIVLWPSSDPATEVAESNSSTSTTIDNENDTWGQEVPTEVFAPKQTTDSTGHEISEAQEEPNLGESASQEFLGTSDSQESETIEVEELQNEFFPQDIETNVAIEDSTPATALNSESDYAQAISSAVDAGNLGPASQAGSATYLLVELIKLNQNSDKISDARTLISKKHLELAKTARSNSQWDKAQQHLDDALKVRLPDSYLPE